MVNVIPVPIILVDNIATIDPTIRASTNWLLSLGICIVTVGVSITVGGIVAVGVSIVTINQSLSQIHLVKTNTTSITNFSLSMY